MSIRVAVVGAAGKMGREVAKAVHEAADMELVGACDLQAAGKDVGELAGLGPVNVVIGSSLSEVLAATRAEVVVDFTEPASVLQNVHIALRAGARAVVGTTGLSRADMDDIDRAARSLGLGVLVAPNFAIGAVLMMHFAREAAAYFPHAEIIELHHEKKKDAPSGTAIKTAEMIRQAWSTRQVAGAGAADASKESIPGARGGEMEGIRIHSVRLPGFVAHQEVLFGLPGQTLTLRHDSTSRESFMPGVLMGIRRVGEVTGLVYGLDKLIFDQ